MRCQVCGADAATRYVEFYSNVGLLFRRYERSIKGYLCKSCIGGYFWEFTLVSLLLGWWGIVSLVLNPFFILNNIIRFIACLTMPGSGGQYITDGDVAGMLRPHVQTMRARLKAGIGLLQVAEETAAATGLAADDVYPYVLAVSGDNIRSYSPSH